MMGNVLRLLDWQIPTVRQRYTRRDTAFYALSLGVGRDPLDLRDLALVDPWADELKALPSMALVLGYPGFWLGDVRVEEATGLKPAQILHVEQAVSLVAPLPVEGEVLGETSVTAVIDKGADRGSLLYSERRIRDAASGALLATCSQVHFLRGAGGCGSGGQIRTGKTPCKPDGEAALQVITPTLAHQALLYRLNGDANPLHIDPSVAKDAGFARPILHGMCTAGMAVAGVINGLADADPNLVKGFSVRMTSPVLPGDTLCTEVWPNGAFRTRALERGAAVLDAGEVDISQR